MAEKRFYTDQEAEQILRLAANTPTEGVSRERLLQMAGELGLSPDAVAQAEEVVRSQGETIQERTEFDVAQRRTFYSQLTTYITVCGALVAFDLFEAHRITWSVWPLLGWGIGVAIMVGRTFMRGSEEYEQDFEKWRANRQERSRAGDALRPRVESILLRESLTKIDAIKRLREETGAQLIDAKNAVENFEKEHPGTLRQG